MEHVRAFSGFPGLAEMQQYLAAKDTSLETSELYSSEYAAKIVAPELRKSRFRAFQDQEIFGLVDHVIQWLNESDDNYSYQLRKDNITETRYEAGGHFLKHNDFLSVTSNLIEEFTLLLCVTPSGLPTAVGGQTLIFPYASEKGTPFDTTKAGNGLLFRKDLDHAGNLLKAGEKHILTANLWATRKQASDQVLFVTFPETAAAAAATNPTRSAQAQLEHAANQNTSYVLPVDCLKGTMLDAHVRFVNRGYESQDMEAPTVVTYECTEFSYQEFGTVAKILNRSCIDEHCIRDHAACIDFFGPFANENLLVNLALASKPDNEEEACKRFVMPMNVKSESSSEKKAKTEGEDKSEETNDLNVIVCENESRTKVVYEVARFFGFDNYVPFKMVFVEGVVSEGYFQSFDKVAMTPVALVLGDYNHVYGVQKFENIQAKTLKDFHEKHLYDVATDGLFSASNDDEEEEYVDDYNDYDERGYDFLSEARGLGLMVAMGEGDTGQTLIQYASHCNLGDDGEWFSVRHEFSHMSYFLGEKTEDESSTETTKKLFHRDENGKATFTKKEAAAASRFIAEMNLDGRVKDALQTKRFELSQEAKQYDSYYCNEATYASFSVLFVTGLVKLDHSIEKAFTEPRHFDAWPSAETKKERKAGIRRDFSRMQINVPSGLDSDGDY